MGDFNASDFTNTTNRTVNVIKNFSEFYGLKQFNEVQNAHNNILDLVFSNTDCKVEPSDSALVKEDPHHPCLWTKVYIPIALPNQFPMNKNPESYNFKKADYPRLYQTICNTNWDFLHSNLSVDKACSQFYDKLTQIFDESVPKMKPIKSNRKFPAWFNSDIIVNLRIKAEMHNIGSHH